MNSATFDTHKAVKSITDAGAKEGLAEAVVETIHSALSGNVATKDDITLLRADLENLKQSMTIRLGAIVIGGLGFLEAMRMLL